MSREQINPQPDEPQSQEKLNPITLFETGVFNEADAKKAVPDIDSDLLKNKLKDGAASDDYFGTSLW